MSEPCECCSEVLARMDGVERLLQVLVLSLAAEADDDSPVTTLDGDLLPAERAAGTPL